MPQPLDKVAPNARKFRWGPGALPDHTDMLAIVAEYAAIWSSIEHAMNRLVAELLKAEVYTVSRIFDAVISERAKRAARLAVVDATITDPQHLAIYKAAAKAVKRISDQRHKFVHHLIGTVPEYHEPHLALMDPKYAAESHAVREEIARAYQRGEDMNKVLDRFPPARQGLDNQHVMVYRKAELEKLLEDAQDVAGIVMRLAPVIAPPKPAAFQGRATIIRRST